MQAQVYFSPPQHVAQNDDQDNSALPEPQNIDPEDNGLPPPITELPGYILSRSINSIPFHPAIIHLKNMIDIFCLDPNICNKLIVNATIKASTVCMWPGEVCNVKGGLLVVMRSHKRPHVIVNIPREHVDLIMVYMTVYMTFFDFAAI